MKATTFLEFTQLAQASPPRVAVILGSGANVVANRVHRVASVAFGDVPCLGAPMVAGHRGRLALGDWAGQRVLVFEGRLHYYEGHSWARVVQPVRLAHQLGARVLLATNAAGGIHPALGPGSLIAVRDHIRWNVLRPWLRPGPGARPTPYSPRLLEILTQAGRDQGIELLHGVYAAVTGPCYETPAEIRALRTCGADAVGMSTAAEIEAAVELGMECAVLSCITNRAAGLSAESLTHEEVLAVAAAQAEHVAQLLERALSRLNWNCS